MVRAFNCVECGCVFALHDDDVEKALRLLSGGLNGLQCDNCYEAGIDYDVEPFQEIATG